MQAPAVPISTALARSLAAQRESLNALVASARRQRPGFDGAAFAGFVQGPVDAVAEAVAMAGDASPQRVDVAVRAAFEVALRLVPRRLAGPAAAAPAVDRAWLTLAGPCAALLAEQPADMLAALSNAALQVAATTGARFDEWLQRTAALAPEATTIADWRAVSALVAWQAGLAPLRIGALHGGDALPPSLARRAAGADASGEWPPLRDSFLVDPWWRPVPAAARAAQANEGHRVGAFSGFGDAFDTPPVVRAERGGFRVTSGVGGGERSHLLIADAFGAVLIPASADASGHADGDLGDHIATAHDAAALPVSVDGSHVVVAKRRVETGWPADGLEAVAGRHSIAARSPYSHAIRVLPRAA